MKDKNRIVAAICGAWSRDGPKHSIDHVDGYDDCDFWDMQGWRWTVTLYNSAGHVIDRVVMPEMFRQDCGNQDESDACALLHGVLATRSIAITEDSVSDGDIDDDSFGDVDFNTIFAWWAVDDTSRSLVDQGYYDLTKLMAISKGQVI